MNPAKSPPPDADFLFYSHGSNVLVQPRNAGAKSYLDAIVTDRDVLGWFSGDPVLEKSAIVLLARDLVAAGFKVVGQSKIVHTRPRLYVNEGEWGLYHSRPMPSRVIRQILKGTGKPN